MCTNSLQNVYIFFARAITYFFYLCLHKGQRVPEDYFY